MAPSRFPDVDVEMELSDPRDRTRTTPMKILVLGYPRTGTSSIQKALEDLGFGPCYHMRTCINQRPRDCELWTEALRAKYDGIGRPFETHDFDHLLGDFSSVCDLPAIALGPELMQAYPEAKIILTTRSPDSWLASCSKTLEMARYYWLHGALQHVDQVSDMVHTMRKETWRCLFDDDLGKNGKAAMTDHCDQIREVAREQGRELLEFHVSNGWGPLCAFLEVDIPREPFPHMNEGDEWVVKMRYRAWKRARSVLARSMMFVAPVATVVAGLLWIRRRQF